MEMLITAKNNRIKALNALERKKVRAARTQRPNLVVKFRNPIFHTTRFDNTAPYLLT